jgi:beta-galactosidase
MDTNILSGKSYYFHHDWSFLLADAFPLKKAIEKWRDPQGNCFYGLDYQEEGWEKVTLPHTFNDSDLFRDRIKDAGSGQKRTVAFYRNWLDVPPGRKGQKVLLEFEGVRQTCYLYVNGALAGYYEAGTAPFGFDITPWVDYERPNLIAIATDNTATRNINYCIAETPNKPDVEPGSYLFPQDEEVDPAYSGVGFFWNCNDFNPSLGGISRPVKVHFKPQIYLTLPLYSNLQTKGLYVYGIDYDIRKRQVKAGVKAELRNESGQAADVWIQVCIKDRKGNRIIQFSSERQKVMPASPISVPLSIVPEDAYTEEILADGTKHYIPVQEEGKVEETATESVEVSVINAVSEKIQVRFWSIDDPYLYTIEVQLFADGVVTDSAVIETGFRKAGYDKDQGVLINDRPVWLRGYAQRAANEWAGIGIAPEWLKDQDAMWIKESNANHIRWMHVAGSPADIRSFDRHGVVCTQPAGDKEQENFGRQWDQRVELMRDIIIAFRNHPSILFWEAGNNSIGRAHMHEMRLLKEKLDPLGGRFMGCRTLNTEDVVNESEYVGTMLNRHAARFTAEHGPVMETEYAREEAPRRVWDDFSPPDFDYKNKWLGLGGRKQVGMDFYDLTSEELALTVARGYSEFFNDRIGGASGKDYYSGCAALCWTDSAQHGRQSFSENGRMSGRVDAARNKKQNFDVFQVMQSPVDRIKILGHWNYPEQGGDHYQYHEKRFNGTYWEETDKILYRDPKHKTVYVMGSYGIAKVVLKVNGRKVGVCEKPVHTFVFPFDNIDVTEHGTAVAYGYDYDGNLVAEDELHTAGAPAQIMMAVHTAPDGLAADGNDVAYIDIRVVDKKGDVCPLCYDKIDFSLEGAGLFLGGYNSGRFAGHGKDDSVIHASHIYAECGTNRVFIRSAKTAGEIVVKAQMRGVPDAEVCFESHHVPLDRLTGKGQTPWYEDLTEMPGTIKTEFTPIPQADAVKYTPEKQPYCKILVNGQEPDTRGVRSVNKNGSIWGAVLCILERMKQYGKDLFDYEYCPDKKCLKIVSDDYTVEAEAGKTHLLVNGEENLMDGEPYVTPEGIFVMEVNAVVSYIKDVTAAYDDKVGVFRIETNHLL